MLKVKKIQAYIGGYTGPSYQLSLIKKNTLSYSKSAYGDRDHLNAEAEVINITDQDMNDFINRLNKLNLIKWKKNYDNDLLILDGTQWHFEIKTDNFHFRSSGSNNFPPEFNRLKIAIRKLVKREFY